MKTLIMLAVVALNALALIAAPSGAANALPDIDENGYRCEGDCDPDTPCRFCNPPKKAKAKKSAAKKVKAKKSGEKSAAKKSRKRGAKPKATGARKRSRKTVVESSENEG